VILIFFTFILSFTTLSHESHSLPFNYTQPLRIWKSGPLIYQLTHSIRNLKNIKLSVQTYTYAQQMYISVDHNKIF